MTAKEIKDYLKTEEKILWEELTKTEKELEERGFTEEEKRKHQKFIIKLAHWAIVWEINKELDNTEE
mgnify:CR=1 FL=1|jgi:hypothetical protein